MSRPATEPSESTGSRKLVPVLGLFSATMIVVGEVIGGGIFYKPSEVARGTGDHLGLILALWIVCGIVSLCGALTTAELATMFPHAGGTYVFLRETYGRSWAFLWAWAEFWVIRSGAIAALAVYSAVTLEELLLPTTPDAPPGRLSLTARLIALAFIALLGSVNIAGTRWGRNVQNVASLVKVASVAFLAILPFVALRHEPFVAGPLWPGTIDRGAIAGIGTALAAIMWAYDGWGNATVVAEEVRDPARNLPRALVGGVLLLTILYTGANLAFHMTLPWNEIIHAKIPAAEVTERLLPGIGYKLLLAMLLVSVFGALNGNILVGPRVLFAVGRDHRRLGVFGRVGAVRATPGYAIAAVCVWAMVLVAIGDLSGEKPLYDALTNYCVFGGSIFYLTAVLAIFVLRVKRPDAERPYRTWGYPLVPAVFVVFYVFFLGSMFLGNTFECAVGLTLIVAGFVVYLWLNRGLA